MKLLFLIIAILLSQFSFSQKNADTVISKLMLDSLETRIYKMADSLKRAQYENVFFKNYNSVDSLTFSKDSVVLNYRDKNGKLIKRITKQFYDSDGSFDYETIDYLNKQQIPEFVEHWETARAEINGQIFKRKIYSYERFVYDSIGRMITWLKFYPAVSRSTVRHITYHYSLTGTQTSTMNRIKIEKFWD
ncbi:MAG: hypothetical protein ABIP30_15650 [Ferruginibacter sp.]